MIEVPTIAVVDRARRRRALRAAMRDLWDWVVVTSPNGAERGGRRSRGRAAAHALRWAVVGPGTAEALAAGDPAALVPDRFVAEGLLDEASPAGPRADGARRAGRPCPAGARRWAAGRGAGR